MDSPAGEGLGPLPFQDLLVTSDKICYQTRRRPEVDSTIELLSA